MNRRKILAMSLLLSCTIDGPAAASAPAYVYEGTVTRAIGLGSSISIDGVSYDAQRTLQNQSLLTSLKAGQRVDVILDAPKGSVHAKIISIKPHDETPER